MTNMKRWIRAAFLWVCIFGWFVPYGYLPWFFAVPVSLMFFAIFLTVVMRAVALEKAKKAQGVG